MNANDFCYWLQGFIEIQNPDAIGRDQIDMIKSHLKLVFTKVTQSGDIDLQKYIQATCETKLC